MEISVEKRNIYLSLILLLTLLSAIFIYQISISNTIQTNVSKIKSNSINKHTNSSLSDSSSSDTSQTNNTDKVKKIAITFDDGPHPEYTLK